MCDDQNFCEPHGFKGHVHGCCGPNFSVMGKMIKDCVETWTKCVGSCVPYNLEDLGDHYLITVPLAGRTKDDVKVSLINKCLNIVASKPKTESKENNSEKEKEKSEKEPFSFLRRFFLFVEVNMDIPLPADADENEIKSAMVNGLLKIKIGKQPPKNIDVSEEKNN